MNKIHIFFKPKKLNKILRIEQIYVRLKPRDDFLNLNEQRIAYFIYTNAIYKIFFFVV